MLKNSSRNAHVTRNRLKGLNTEREPPPKTAANPAASMEAARQRIPMTFRRSIGEK